MEARERAVVNFVQTLKRFNCAIVRMSQVAQAEEPVKVRVFVIDHLEIVQSFWSIASLDVGGFYRPVTRGPSTVMTQTRQLRGTPMR